MKRNILTQLNTYQRFCDRYRLGYFPADNRQLCRFAQSLALSFESPESVGNYQSGICTCHAILGIEPPDIKEKQNQWFMLGLKHIMDHELKQASPITPEILVRMSTVVDYTNQTDMVAWVAILLDFTLFLCKSNLVPQTMDTFDGSLQFCRKDLNVVDPLSPMMVEIRWSKTNQHKKKILRVPVLPTKNKSICPVLWMHYMINTIPAQADDAIFTIYSDGKKTLSANQLVARMRKWLLLIKEPAHLFSLHSLCRGGVTFAHRCNIESQMIQLLGDWASDAYKRYIDITIDDRYKTMEAFVEGLNKLM